MQPRQRTILQGRTRTGSLQWEGKSRIASILHPGPRLMAVCTHHAGTIGAASPGSRARKQKIASRADRRRRSLHGPHGGVVPR